MNRKVRSGEAATGKVRNSSGSGTARVGNDYSIIATDKLKGVGLPETKVPEVSEPEVTMVNGKKVIKVTASQISAARARVEADRRLGNATPSWIVRISRLSSRNPLG
ncbi:hypothetical protein [Cellulosimicrobium sp. TH-20]|uniref:hypothetical protein n=1 Tax=Cellulosimicrobium sp. TH-20 TaxID=1980001 RepID=UPI0011A054C4|nr:hypothetical protein [Cellulosimicrobium sp. TH-20]